MLYFVYFCYIEKLIICEYYSLRAIQIFSKVSLHHQNPVLLNRNYFIENSEMIAWEMDEMLHSFKRKCLEKCFDWLQLQIYPIVIIESYYLD